MLVAVLALTIMALFVFGAINILVGWIFGAAAAAQMRAVVDALIKGAWRLVVVFIGLLILYIVVGSQFGWPGLSG